MQFDIGMTRLWDNLRKDFSSNKVLQTGVLSLGKSMCFPGAIHVTSGSSRLQEAVPAGDQGNTARATIILQQRCKSKLSDFM